MLTTTAQGRTWNFSYALGRNAAAGNGFTQPISVATGHNNVLYVLSRGAEGSDGRPLPNTRIGKMTMDHEFIGDMGQGDLTWPVDLAVDSNGILFCSDEHLNTIFMYGEDGDLMGQWGIKGQDEGEFDGPCGIAFNSEDRLYVVDSGNCRIGIFTTDGAFVDQWGSRGSGKGQFIDPWGITIDSSGNVYVADWGNDRIQKFGPDGTFILSFGDDLPDTLGLKRPSDVAVDSEGDVYVVDWGNKRVQIFDCEGEVITGLYGDAHEISKWAHEVVQSNPDALKAYRRVEDTTPLARFERPTSVAIDKDNRIIISESTRGRLQIYEKEKDYMDPQFNL